MSQDSKKGNVKSKKRVADHSEVFTAEMEVNTIFGLFEEESLACKELKQTEKRINLK